MSTSHPGEMDLLLMAADHSHPIETGDGASGGADAASAGRPTRRASRRTTSTSSGDVGADGAIAAGAATTRSGRSTGRGRAASRRAGAAGGGGASDLPAGCVRQNVGKRGSSWKARVTVNTITLQRCFKTKEEADAFAREAREYKSDPDAAVEHRSGLQTAKATRMLDPLEEARLKAHEDYDEAERSGARQWSASKNRKRRAAPGKGGGRGKGGKKAATPQPSPRSAVQRSTRGARSVSPYASDGFAGAGNVRDITLPVQLRSSSSGGSTGPSSLSSGTPGAAPLSGRTGPPSRRIAARASAGASGMPGASSLRSGSNGPMGRSQFGDIPVHPPSFHMVQSNTSTDSIDGVFADSRRPSNLSKVAHMSRSYSTTYGPMGGATPQAGHATPVTPVGESDRTMRALLRGGSSAGAAPVGLHPYALLDSGVGAAVASSMPGGMPSGPPPPMFARSSSLSSVLGSLVAEPDRLAHAHSARVDQARAEAGVADLSDEEIRQRAMKEVMELVKVEAAEHAEVGDTSDRRMAPLCEALFPFLFDSSCTAPPYLSKEVESRCQARNRSVFAPVSASELARLDMVQSLLPSASAGAGDDSAPPPPKRLRRTSSRAGSRGDSSGGQYAKKPAFDWVHSVLELGDVDSTSPVVIGAATSYEAMPEPLYWLDDAIQRLLDGVERPAGVPAKQLDKVVKQFRAVLAAVDSVRAEAAAGGGYNISLPLDISFGSVGVVPPAPLQLTQMPSFGGEMPLGDLSGLPAETPALARTASGRTVIRPSRGR